MYFSHLVCFFFYLLHCFTFCLIVLSSVKYVSYYKYILLNCPILPGFFLNCLIFLGFYLPVSPSFILICLILPVFNLPVSWYLYFTSCLIFNRLSHLPAYFFLSISFDLIYHLFVSFHLAGSFNLLSHFTRFCLILHVILAICLNFTTISCIPSLYLFV